jgi:hypothetical protein
MKKFIIKKVVPKAVDTWEVEAENQGDADFAIYKRYDNAILKKHETFDADYGDADFTIFEDDLSGYTSEELLYEVHKRRNIYIEGWYNAYYINKYTGLPMQYCDVFIKWDYDTACDGDLEVAVEQWLDKMKINLDKYNS